MASCPTPFIYCDRGSTLLSSITDCNYFINVEVRSEGESLIWKLRSEL